MAQNANKWRYLATMETLQANGIEIISGNRY